MTLQTHKAAADARSAGARAGACPSPFPGTSPASGACLSAPATSPAASVAGAFSRQGVKRPVCWRGQSFPSISAAAKAAGVSRQAFSEAVKLNRVHMVGTGPHKAFEDRKQPVAAHGWHWPSQKHAAEALGVAPKSVCEYLQRGTFEKHVLRRLGVKP